MIVNYFVLDGVVVDTTAITATLMLTSFALQWVSFVSMIESVAGVFGIEFANVGGSLLTHEGLSTYLKLIAFTTIPAILFYVPLCCIIDLYFYESGEESLGL